MKVRKIFVDDFRISYVFSFQDPFVEDDLKSLLEKKGFKAEIGSRIIEAPPFRAVKADIAKRGNVAVLYDNDVSFVGVAGRSFKEVVDNFATLEATLKELDRIAFDKKSTVEIVIRARVWTKKDPQKTIADFMKTEKIEPFKKIFGHEVRPFTVSVVTQDPRITDNPNWFSLRIEPQIKNPRYYFVELVYRNESVSKALGIAGKIEKVINDSIGIIEK
jgi:hypothetical protein